MKDSALPMRSLLSLFAVLCALTSPAGAMDVLRIGGTGMGLRAMERLGEQFSRSNKEIAVQVLPSLGTSGGLNAVRGGAIDIALAARLLTPSEQEKGLTQAICVTTALVFATSKRETPDVYQGMSSAWLAALYADPRPVWPDQTPLKIILRAQSGSEVPYLIGRIPDLAPAFELAYKRGGLPIGATDQENADLAVKTRGSLAITTLLQIQAENLALVALPFNGIDPTADTIADGSYSLPLPMCLVLPKTPSSAAARFVAHMKTPNGAALLRRFGAIMTP
jgi:phosphate transport system substrate-binding protein